MSFGPSRRPFLNHTLSSSGRGLVGSLDSPYNVVSNKYKHRSKILFTDRDADRLSKTIHFVRSSSHSGPPETLARYLAAEWTYLQCCGPRVHGRSEGSEEGGGVGGLEAKTLEGGVDSSNPSWVDRLVFVVTISARPSEGVDVSCMGDEGAGDILAGDEGGCDKVEVEGSRGEAGVEGDCDEAAVKGNCDELGVEGDCDEAAVGVVAGVGDASDGLLSGNAKRRSSCSPESCVQ